MYSILMKLVSETAYVFCEKSKLALMKRGTTYREKTRPKETEKVGGNA